MSASPQVVPCFQKLCEKKKKKEEKTVFQGWNS